MTPTTPITITVPGAPVPKGRPRIVRIAGHARMATPEKTVAYEGLVAHAAQQAMAGREPIAGGVAVQLDIGLPVPASWSAKKQAGALAGTVLATKKPDADNVVKAIFDGLNGVVWRDDVQVVRLVTQKRYAAAPGVRVEIVALESAA